MGKRERKDDEPCWYPFWKDRAWRYDFRVEGERFRRSTGVCCPESLEIAKEVAKGVHDAAWDRALSPFPTLKEAADLYLAEFDTNRGDVDRVVDYFGPFVRVNEIDAFAIKKCKVELTRPTWGSEETARKHVTTPLKAVLNNAFGLRPVRRVKTTRARAP